MWVNIYLTHRDAVWEGEIGLLFKVFKTKELTALFYDCNELVRGASDFREILLYLEHFPFTSWESGGPQKLFCVSLDQQEWHLT